MITQGNWIIVSLKNKTEHHIRLSVNGEDIAVVGDLNNAALIAAAPLLLAACEDIAFLEKTNMTKKQVQLRIDIAKAAIKAAKGVK